MGYKPNPLLSETLVPIEWDESSKELMIDPELQGDALVYRYCTIAEALLLIRHGKMAFAHPTAWKDKFEHEVQSKIFGKSGRFAHQLPLMKCFSLEWMSEPMWRIYASNGGLVRVKFHLREVLDVLSAASWKIDTVRVSHKLYCGRARYMSSAALRSEVAKFASLSDKKKVRLACPHQLLWPSETDLPSRTKFGSPSWSKVTQANSALIAQGKSSR